MIGMWRKLLGLGPSYAEREAEYQKLFDEVQPYDLADQTDEVIREHLIKITEEYNALWKEARFRKLGLRPWVDWQDKVLLLTEWSGESIVLAPSSHANDVNDDDDDDDELDLKERIGIIMERTEDD